VLAARIAQSAKGNECGIGIECQSQLIACHSMLAEDGNGDGMTEGVMVIQYLAVSNQPKYLNVCYLRHGIVTTAWLVTWHHPHGWCWHLVASGWNLIATRLDRIYLPLYLLCCDYLLYIGALTERQYTLEVTLPRLAVVLVHHVLEGQFRLHRPAASHTVSVSDVSVYVNMSTRLIRV
jgi:hypothetical protein